MRTFALDGLPNDLLTNEIIGERRLKTESNVNDGSGNSIDSFRGAINIHDACVHHIPVNEYFHRHTGVETTLSVASSAGDTSITVVSATGFNEGDFIQIENGVIETTHPQITDITGTVFTLDRPLDYGFEIGDDVGAVTTNMAVAGTLANPIAFELRPDADQNWHLVRFLIGMAHAGVPDDGKFGGIAGLTNGVVMRGYDAENDQYRTFTLWKTNGDIKMDMYDVDYSEKAPAGENGTSSRGSLKLGTGAVANLNGVNGDYLELLIQDDLTDLTTFRVKGQGHIEGI